MAKPRLLEDEKIKEKIIKWVRDSHVTKKEICHRLGCDHGTLNRELARDPQFAQRFKDAEWDARDWWVDQWKVSAPKDWRGCYTFLAAKYGEEFSKKPGLYSIEDFQSFALKMSDLVRKYVPESSQLAFGKEVETILEQMEEQRKKNERKENMLVK